MSVVANRQLLGSIYGRQGGGACRNREGMYRTGSSVAGTVSQAERGVAMRAALKKDGFTAYTVPYLNRIVYIHMVSTLPLIVSKKLALAAASYPTTLTVEKRCTFRYVNTRSRLGQTPICYFCYSCSCFWWTLFCWSLSFPSSWQCCSCWSPWYSSLRSA